MPLSAPAPFSATALCPINPYQCTTELHPISEVANLEKKVPLSWMNANHTQMTEEFLDYARPLIQAELTPLYIAGLPHHIYLKK